MNRFLVLPCLDSDEIAESRRKELCISRVLASGLGHSAVAASDAGSYINRSGERVLIAQSVEAARAAKRSIAPEDPGPITARPPLPVTRIQVSNETTLAAARRLADRGLNPLALNFANGINPGGGFLQGACAQEDVLCRSSALYITLADDPMYAEHRERSHPDSTDWAILSPDVPVFREDDGTPLDQPWLLSFITCAAPHCRFGSEHIADLFNPISSDLTYTALPAFSARHSANLLRLRIHRVLAIARAYGYKSLVLGAWGCGWLGNDPQRAAADFRQALRAEFRGAFSEVVFAITDWTPERKFLGPFRDEFALRSERPNESIISGLSHASRSSPRQRQLARQYALSEETLLGVKDATLFYPCAGRDLLVPIRLFSPFVTDFWFADQDYFGPAHRDTSYYGLDMPANELPPVLEHDRFYQMTSSHVCGEPSWDRHDGDIPPCVLTQEYRHLPSGRMIRIHLRRGYALSALRKEISSLGVFFYRGDSQGEGGSGHPWLGSERINEICAKLINGGLIATDGSQGSRGQYMELTKLHGNPVDEDMDPVKAVSTFDDKSGRHFECIGYAGRRYGPTLIWRVTWPQSDP